MKNRRWLLIIPAIILLCIGIYALFGYRSLGNGYLINVRGYYYRNLGFFGPNAVRKLGSNIFVFKKLYGPYAKDTTYAYFYGNQMNVSDVSSFTALSSWYAKDKDHVYVRDRISAFLYPGSFRVYKEAYGTDGRAVYFGDIFLYNADPLTFQEISTQSEYYAKDKNYVWRDSHIIPDADAASFMTFPGTYFSKDNSHVYVQGAVINEITEPDKFTVDTYGNAAYNNYTVDSTGTLHPSQ